MVEPAGHDNGAGDADDSATRTVIVRPGGIRAAAAVDDRVHYLVVVEGEEPGRRVEITDKPTVIGRSRPADFVIADALVSRSHCRVGLVMGEVFVTDQGSSNGTLMEGARISGSRFLGPGDRFIVGSHVFEHEWRSRREVEAMRAQDSDLEKAKTYVRSLLPRPLVEGPVRTDWVLQPSANLGGDMFGYHFIDERTYAVYLLDVTGHGTDAAMHAVSVMNVLRQPNVPGLDARDPARMAAHLNEMFQMESHGGMLLSLWHGVVDLASRTVTFVSAGHHAAYLVAADGATAALDVSNVLIGMMPGYAYRSGQAAFSAGSSLYLFSDGVFEVEPANGEEWDLERFVQLLVAPSATGKPGTQGILENVKARTGRDTFEDDFTLVASTFG